MAHMIDNSTGRAAMAYAGARPWHGLGAELTAGASIETWTREAGLDWLAMSAVPMFQRADGSVGMFDDKQVIYRGDTGAPLSVMGAGYKIVQPRDVLEFFRNVVRDHGFSIETAGALNGGRKIWALARNGHAGEVVKGDSVRQYLLLATSLDGSTPTVAAYTSVRVVCQNTMREAFAEVKKRRGADRAGSVVVTSHRSDFDAASVREQLGVADKTWQKYMEQMRTLAATPCDMEEARELLRRVFGQPVSTRRKDDAEPTTATAANSAGHDSLASLMQGEARVIDAHADALAAHEGRSDVARLIAQGSMREQKSVARCLSLFAGEGMGAELGGVAGTRWGLLNAVTQHIDHEQGRTADNRMSSAWFGRGDAAKSEFARLLVGASGAMTEA